MSRIDKVSDNSARKNNDVVNFIAAVYVPCLILSILDLLAGSTTCVAAGIAELALLGLGHGGLIGAVLMLCVSGALTYGFSKNGFFDVIYGWLGENYYIMAKMWRYILRKRH